MKQLTKEHPNHKYLEALVEWTRRFDEENDYTPVKKVAASPRLQEISDLVRTIAGCSEKDFRKLVELMLDTTLPPPIKPKSTTSVKYLKWSVVVLKDNPNSHNYPKNEPILIYYTHDSEPSPKAHGITKAGHEGNWLPEFRTSARPATVEEIEEFLLECDLDCLGSYLKLALTELPKTS